jgi:hypothetical protein
VIWVSRARFYLHSNTIFAIYIYFNYIITRSNDFYCYIITRHEPELLFTHRLKIGFVHPLRVPGDVNRFFRSRTGRYRSLPDHFLDHFYAFRHRLHRIDTIFTATNVTTQTDLSLLDHPQKWDFWTHRRRSAEKMPTSG